MVGHDSHISYEVIEMAVQENRIIILPPQPLDFGIFCSMKADVFKVMDSVKPISVKSTLQPYLKKNLRNQ